MARRKFVLFELNEVPFRVLRRHARHNPNSAIARVLAEGQRWETVAEDDGHLSPWVTWPTVHRGVTNRAHGITALGQDIVPADVRYPPVWTLLARAGRKVGVFGSLHSYPPPASPTGYAFYLPDTFAAGPETFPPALSAFQRFNLGMVDRSGRNVSNDMLVGDGLRFLMKAPRLGVRARTVARIAGQLAAEQRHAHRNVRRRTLQSELSFDLFFRQLRSTRPDAAFYFTNHLASAMHRYWPATFARDYLSIDWSGEWRARFAGEIDFAMAAADAMLARLIALADRDPRLVVLVAGSMGQAAVDMPEAQQATQVLLRDPVRMMAALAMPAGWKRRRAMEPRYTFTLPDPAAANSLIAALERLTIGGAGVVPVRLDRCTVAFELGQANLAASTPAILGDRVLPLDALGLENVEIQDEVGAAAYHVPQGCLLAYDPRASGAGRVFSEQLSTTRLAPTLLAMLDVPIPAYMPAPIAALVPG